MAKSKTNTNAVMGQRRAKADNEGLTDEERGWKERDFYGTPPWAARAGAEIAKSIWPHARTVREPAAGMLSMAIPLQEYFPEVLPSDVYPYLPNVPVIDWFDPAEWPEEPDCDLVITNPPFVTAAPFLRLALKRARLGVGILVRTVWIESSDRYSLFEGGDNPLTLLCPFSERVAMRLGPWDPSIDTATSYSWLFWSKGDQPRPPKWIVPGTRDRLWFKTDASEYGRHRPMPLFPEPGDVI